MARGIMAPVRERKEGAVAKTDVTRKLVSSQMQAANVQSHWRGPDIGGLIKDVAVGLDKYYQAEKEAAFKRFDIEASKMQLEELEAIRVADNNEAIPEIEKSFKNNLNTAFAQDSWGKKWLKERGELFLAANSRDVMRAGIAKQHELYTLEMNKTLGAWANDIASSASDKAKVLMGDADAFVDSSELLSPEEKQKAKDNFAKLTLQRAISANPTVALNMLDDADYKWNEKGIDVDNYKTSALASIKNAENKRLIGQINNNSKVAMDLIQKSQEDRISLDEINSKVPESSKELRALLYDINGYKTEDGKITLSDDQKAIITSELYSRAAGLANNPKTSIKDWEQLEKDIYSQMGKGGALSKSEGVNLITSIAKPYMESYKDNVDEMEEWHLFGKDYGYGQIEKLIKDNGLDKKISDKKYKDKAVRERLQAEQAMQKTAIYRAYGENIEALLKAKNMSSISDLDNLTSKERDNFYNDAYNMTLQSLNQSRFKSLQMLAPEELPNAAVGENDTKVNTVSSGFEKAKEGTPINSQIKQVGTKGGKYYARTSDGKTIEITENQYNQFKGL